MPDTSLATILLVVNGPLILIILILVALMTNWGSKFNYYYGVADIQEPLRKKILFVLLAIIFLSLAAVLFNIITPMVYARL